LCCVLCCLLCCILWCVLCCILCCVLCCFVLCIVLYIVLWKRVSYPAVVRQGVWIYELDMYVCMHVCVCVCWDECIATDRQTPLFVVTKIQRLCRQCKFWTPLCSVALYCGSSTSMFDVKKPMNTKCNRQTKGYQSLPSGAHCSLSVLCLYTVFRVLNYVNSRQREQSTATQRG